MRTIEAKKIYRVIDANFNRAKEALRVCEDVCRFFLNSKTVTSQYKDVRHRLTTVVSKLGVDEIMKARNVEGDPGKATTTTELKRRSCADIFYANSQRAKESVRVLEEFAKLTSSPAALGLKNIRYKIYELEQTVVRKL